MNFLISSIETRQNNLMNVSFSNEERDQMEQDISLQPLIFPEEEQEVLSELSKACSIKLTMATGLLDETKNYDERLNATSSVKTEVQKLPEPLEINSDDANSSSHLRLKLARRTDVVSKTLIRSLKRFYSEYFCPSERILYDIEDEEAIETFNNIDTVSILFLPYSLQTLLTHTYSFATKYSLPVSEFQNQKKLCQLSKYSLRASLISWKIANPC